IVARQRSTCHVSRSLLLLPPPILTLFPYTTLFRSSTGPYGRSIAREASACVGKPAAVAAAAPAAAPELRAVAVEYFPVNEPAKRSEEHTSELQSRFDLVCRLLLVKKKQCYRCHKV